MKKVIVIKITEDELTFSDGSTLYSYHEQDCCESHYLDFSDLTLEDFKGLEFDISEDNFFRKVEGYGIELLPLAGWPIRVPGYGYNNGYYSTDLTLILSDNLRGNPTTKRFDISECQTID